MHMCLPFGALIREIWYSDRGISSEMKESKLHKLSIFWANYCTVVKAPNLVKTGCFSCKNGILMGGKLGKKIVWRKSHLRGPTGTSTYDFGERTPPPGN